jgi:hypothetical protein
MFRITNKRHQEAIDLAASARQFKDQVQAALADKLAGKLREGESLPDLTFFQEVIGRVLEESSASIREVDRRHTDELASTAGLRAQRNQLVARLRARVRDVRYLVDRSVDPATAKTALRERRVSRVTADLLVAGARDLATVLRNPEHPWIGDNAVFGTAPEVALMLETDAAQLEELLLRLAPQKKASQDQLSAKQDEIEAVTETNRRCVDALFGLYRLAGLDFHADRLRAKVRKRKLEEPEEQPPSPGTALQRIG